MKKKNLAKKRIWGGVVDGVAPTISAATVLLATPNNWVIVFDEAVFTTAAGWTLKINGAGATITNTINSGTDTITFTTTETPVSGDILTLDYSSGSGDCTSVANSVDLASVTGQSIEAIIAYTGGNIENLSNVTVDGGGNSYTSTIWVSNLQTVKLQNFNFSLQGRFALSSNGTTNLRITECNWDGNTTEECISINAWQGSNYTIDGLEIDHCIFANSDIPSYIVHINQANNVEIHQCQFTGNLGTAVNHTSMIIMSLSSGSIHNCYASDNYGNFVRFWGKDGGATNEVYDIVFINNRKYSFVEYSGNAGDPAGWDFDVYNCTAGDLEDDSVGPPPPDTVNYETAGITIYNPINQGTASIITFINCNIFNTTVGEDYAGRLYGTDGPPPNDLTGSVYQSTRGGFGYTTDASVKLPDGREWNNQELVPTISSVTIENAVPTDVVMVFSEIVNGTNLGFTLSGTTSTVFSSISGFGTNTLTGVLADAVLGTEVPLLSYDDAVGDIINVTSGALKTFNNLGIQNNIFAAPVVQTMVVNNANANEWIVNFDVPVTNTTTAGWSFKIDGVAATITGVAGTGTAQLTFTVTETVLTGEVLLGSYDPSTGNCIAVDGGLELALFTDSSVVNGIGVSKIDIVWDTGSITPIPPNTGVNVFPITSSNPLTSLVTQDNIATSVAIQRTLGTPAAHTSGLNSSDARWDAAMSQEGDFTSSSVTYTISGLNANEVVDLSIFSSITTGGTMAYWLQGVKQTEFNCSVDIDAKIYIGVIANASGEITIEVDEVPGTAYASINCLGIDRA